jgi:molecular chaperone GrpE
MEGEVSEDKTEASETDRAVEDGLEVSSTEEVRLLELKVTELEDRLLRSIAEVQNVQRRADREKDDATRYGVTGFARDILIVRDNLQRAFESCNEAADCITDGIKLTLSEMDKVLGRHGVSRIESSGSKFDPHLHQALDEIESSDEEPGTVVRVMQEGFVIHDRLLRPALVVISKK